VTADGILEHSGAYRDPAAASPSDRTWSELCAAAISAGFDLRLADAFPTGDEPELRAAALTAGVEIYKRREATFGLTQYVDLQGAAIRIARDYLEAVAPILDRYATRGIA
jgi:hypothetical protein